MDRYVQNSYGVVYKKVDDHYLQLSPWKQGEDRRVSEVEYEDCVVLTFENACMIINKQFDETNEEWENRGCRYIARSVSEKSIDEHIAILSMLPSHKIRIQGEEMVNELGDGSSITMNIPMNTGTEGLDFKMCRHKGKIYYILIVNETWISGRAKAYDLFGKFCQWVGVKHVKPIFNITDKKYV